MHPPQKILIIHCAVTDITPTTVSALGAIPRPDYDGIRLIHDCSQPEGNGLSTYAEIDKFSFQSLEDAITLPGPHYYMEKINLRNAYRTIPIHKSNFQATGLKWKFRNSHTFAYFMDTRLPFGGCRVPKIISTINNEIDVNHTLYKRKNNSPVSIFSLNTLKQNK